MPKIPQKPIYEKPIIRDLFAFSAQGQVTPNGECAAGPTPYYSCQNGTAFVGACSTGTTPDTSACGGGSYHKAAACKPGSVAATVCFSGSGQNF